MRAFAPFIDLLLPPRCPITGEEIDRQGGISAEAWKELSFISRPYCQSCGFPFEYALPSGASEQLCAPCLYKLPAYSLARSALVYNDASRDFILGFKHGDKTHAVISMIPWLKNAGADFLADADVIVPVPLHRWRLLKRRYNQAALMGYALGRAVGIKCLPDALIRTRATVSQGHLRPHERHKNVRSAFTVPFKKQAFLNGKKVVLIDDVYTTGATVEECANSLFKAGADKVFVLTLARVVRPERL